MTRLQEKLTGYIPSVTMREYLAEKMERGEFAPSYEDMASTVFNFSKKDIFCNAEFYRLLLKEPLEENIRKELEWHINMAENVREYIGNKDMRYAFECQTLYETSPPVYNSFRKALKRLKHTGSAYLAVIDKRISGADKHIAEMTVDEKGNIIRANNYHSTRWKYPDGSVADRYVKYPVPFRAGDVVYYVGDKERRLFCVIDARQPDPGVGTDSIDASMVVIPYEFREYASPENIRAHYERLAERRRNGIMFYDESTELDVISREHDHMGVLYAELWKENQYDQ
ncbi:MAG: hypothetical protein ACI4XF_03010 [Oscillospiraceae bacterium]